VRQFKAGFTIAELLVSLAVLVVFVLLIGRLFSSASSVTMSGNKHMDIEGEIRPLFERMAVDFSQMVKRSELDFFGKNTGAPNSIGGPMTGNDQLAFYATVPGYYPATGSQSPISVVAYRVNSTTGSNSFDKLERMAKGLVWNGVSAINAPVVFLPLTISGTWPAATDSSSDADYEIMGTYVFRFEYYYLLNNGSLSDRPWDTATGHTSISGMQDVAAVSVAIAAIDSKSKVLISDSQMTTLAGRLGDFSAAMRPGDLCTQWQGALDATTDMPRPAISAVRIYERYFYLLPRP